MIDTYWVSETVLIEWVLTDANGNPVTSASVSGTVRGPGGSTTPVTAAHSGAGLYRAAFEAPAAGLYSWRLESASPDGARAGVFEVLPDPEPADPPTLDPSTPVGRVRLYIPDLDPRALLFTDAQIEAFLEDEGSNRRRAAAFALEVASTNEAMVSKVIRTQDLSTDGPAVAAEMRARAAILRSQAAKADDDAAAQTAVGAFTIRPYGAPDPRPAYWPAWREQR